MTAPMRIPARCALLPRIFGCFYRADRARSLYPRETGLAMVTSIMDMHKQMVAVESEPAKGTTVTPRFPPAKPSPKLSELSSSCYAPVRGHPLS